MTMRDKYRELAISYGMDDTEAAVISERLNQDVYNDKLDALAVTGRLVENIHLATNSEFEETGLIPVWTVARLIEGIWRHKNREFLDYMAETERVLHDTNADEEIL
jgi:hypothetical protein